MASLAKAAKAGMGAADEDIEMSEAINDDQEEDVGKAKEETQSKVIVEEVGITQDDDADKVEASNAAAPAAAAAAAAANDDDDMHVDVSAVKLKNVAEERLEGPAEMSSAVLVGAPPAEPMKEEEKGTKQEETIKTGEEEAANANNLEEKTDEKEKEKDEKDEDEKEEDEKDEDEKEEDEKDEDEKEEDEKEEDEKEEDEKEEEKEEKEKEEENENEGDEKDTDEAETEDGASTPPPRPETETDAGADADANAARLRSEELNRALSLADVESTHATLRAERDALRAAADEDAKLASKLRAEASALREEVADKERELAREKAERARETAAREAAEERGKEQRERAERAWEEMDALREEISQLTASKSALSAELSKLRTSASLANSSAIPLKFELERTRADLESVKSHAAWLESELDARTADLAKTRAAHSSKSASFQSDLEDAKAARNEANASLDTSRRAEARLRSELDRASARLRDERSEAADRVSALEEELVAERRLAELSKEKADRAEARCDAMRGEMASVKKLAEAAAAESSAELETFRVEMEEKASEAMEALAAMKDGTIAELRGQVEEAERGRRKAEEELMNSPTLSKRRRRRAPLTPSDGDGSDRHHPDDAQEAEPMSLSDLYMRLSETEDELAAERIDNKRLHLMLRRIQLDIEQKTPLLRQQAREAEAAIRAGAELHARTEDALAEAESERARARAAEEERSAREEECRALRRENADLAAQVQALLRRVAGAASSPPLHPSSAGGDVVEFGSVEEMQSQNQRLLREHRRLQERVADLEAKLDAEPLRIRAEEAESELVLIRAERERQATLMSGIVQQRDLYRALLAKSDGRALASAERVGGDVLAIEDGSDTHAEAAKRELESRIAELQSDLLSANNAKAALENQVARLDVYAADLSSSVDALRTEVSVAHAAQARSDADAGYYRDKVARLEESLDNARREVARGAEARKEFQRLNVQLQERLDVVRASESKWEQQFLQVQAKLRLSETQVQTAQSAESRVAAEAASLRNELARQGELLTSVQRIEASLSARTSEERSRLEEELVSKTETLESERLRRKAEVAELKSRIADADLRASEAEKEKIAALNNMAKAREDAVRAKEDYRAISDRCTALESTLLEANRRLGETGVQEVDEEQVASSAAQLEKAKADLVTANERIRDLKGIAAANEREVLNLTKAHEEYQAAKNADINQLSEDLAVARRTSQRRQEMLDELGKELATHRGEQEKVVNGFKNRLVAMEAERKSFEEDAAAARARAESLAHEIERYQSDATLATNNYERELALHAAARGELQKARLEKEEQARLRQTAESQLDALRLESVAEKKAMEDMKSRIEQSLSDAEARLEEAREQNKVLHSQMATLTETVEKLQSERMTTLTSAGDSGGASASESASAEEVASLRKTVSELREVVKYMRSEREIHDAQLDAVRRTAERERAAAAAARRSLDSARNELQALQDGQTGYLDKENERPAAEKEADEIRYRNAEEQLTLLRESNKLLREEAVKTERALESTRKEVEELRKTFNPMESKCRLLEADKTALEAEKASLVREVDAWKGRVQSLVSKFNQIDPEEHARALAQADAAKRECDSLKTLKEQAEKESSAAKALVNRLSKEISQLKSQLDNVKSSYTKILSEKASLLKATSMVDSLTKERDQLKDAVKKAETRESTAKTDLAAATKRVENFQKMLRKMKTQIVELKNENQDVASKHKELEEALAKQKEAKERSQTANEKMAENVSNPLSDAVTAGDKAEAEPEKEMPLAEKQAEPSAATLTHSAVTTAQVLDTPKIPEGGFRFAPSIALNAAAKEFRILSPTKSSVPTSDDQDNEQVDAEKKLESSLEQSAQKVRLPAINEEAVLKAASPLRKMPLDPDTGTLAKPGSPKPTGAESLSSHVAKEDALRKKLLERKRLLAAKVKKMEEEVVNSTVTKRESNQGPEPVQKAAPTEDDVTKEDQAKPDAAERPAITAPDTHQKEVGSILSGETDDVAKFKLPISSGTSAGDIKAAPVPSFGSGTGVGFSKPAAAPVFGTGSLSGKSPLSLGQGLSLGGASVLGTPLSRETPREDSSVATSGTPAAAESRSTASSTFLNLTPPGSGGAKHALVFGTSTIKLPTPKGKIATPVAPSYGIFRQPSACAGSASSSPFGVPAGFGSVLSKKRPPEADGDDAARKISRRQEQLGGNDPPKGKGGNDEAEEGEIVG